MKIHLHAWIELVSRERRSTAAGQLYARLLLQQAFTHWLRWSHLKIDVTVNIKVEGRKRVALAVLTEWYWLRRALTLAQASEYSLVK